MGKNKDRTLFSASLMILLCLIMLIGGTYALWTRGVPITNHLTAGALNVKLERISLTKTYLDNDTGYLVTTQPDTTVVDFSGTSEGNAQNVFGLTNHGASNAEKIVPGCAYEARMRITNNGDVAFTYEVIIRLNSASNALAEQLKVYVAEGDGVLVDAGFLSAYATEDGTAIVSTQAMAKNDAAKEFTVKLEFVNDTTVNNAAQAQTADFDLLVNAVQKTNAQ